MLAELKFGTSHDERREQVECVAGRSCGSDELGYLRVNELIGLRRDVASDEGGLEDAKDKIGTRGC